MFRSAVVPPRPSLVCAAFLAFAVLAGCADEAVDLAWDDLDPDERTYVERFMVLERARAVTFMDLELGRALLDSLAVAWDDTTAGLPEELVSDPARLGAVHALLERMLAAEQDSLLQRARPGRLTAPLPVLDPPAPAP